MKIGLTYTGDPTKHQNYVNWLVGSDDIHVIRLSAADDNLQQLPACDALVLSGGIDIDPSVSHGSSSYPNMPARFQPERDLFEKELYEMAIAANIPVLGICRGMQLVNVLEGGTLIEDLDALNDQHQKNGTTDKSHTVQVKDHTLLREIAGTATGEINSAHHQAIDNTGPSLQVNSTAEDGTVEGLEWKDKEGKPFLLCVQWHPERMFQFPGSPFSINIRNRFIEEIQKSITSKNENN